MSRFGKGVDILTLVLLLLVFLFWFSTGAVGARECVSVHARANVHVSARARVSVRSCLRERVCLEASNFVVVLRLFVNTQKHHVVVELKGITD